MNAARINTQPESIIVSPLGEKRKVILMSIFMPSEESGIWKLIVEGRDRYGKSLLAGFVVDSEMVEPLQTLGNWHPKNPKSPADGLPVLRRRNPIDGKPKEISLNRAVMVLSADEDPLSLARDFESFVEKCKTMPMLNHPLNGNRYDCRIENWKIVISDETVTMALPVVRPGEMSREETIKAMQEMNKEPLATINETPVEIPKTMSYEAWKEINKKLAEMKKPPLSRDLIEEEDDAADRILGNFTKVTPQSESVAVSEKMVEEKKEQI